MISYNDIKDIINSLKTEGIEARVRDVAYLVMCDSFVDKALAAKVAYQEDDKPSNKVLSMLAEKQQTAEPYAYIEPEPSLVADPVVQYMNRTQLEKAIERTRKQMTEAAKKLDFIEAAQFRDELVKLEDLLKTKKD